MTSLVLELQRDAMDPNVRVSDVLRKAIAVATLGVDDFKAWAEKELAGYGRESTPPYRRVQCEIPEPPSLPTKVWINLPSRDESVAQLVH